MDTMPGMDMPMPDQNADAEGPAIGLHGMLIVGEETIYVSHLPMWMQPHNFQVILEVTFAGPDQPQARYVADRKATGTRLYTLNPRQQWDIRESLVDELTLSDFHLFGVLQEDATKLFLHFFPATLDRVGKFILFIQNCFGNTLVRVNEFGVSLFHLVANDSSHLEQEWLGNA